MTTQTTHRGDAARRTARALGALGALVILVAAVPLLLVTLMQALPLDLAALSPSALGRPEDGRLLLWAIVAMAWVAWAGMVLSVGVETWAALRRAPTPRLPGLAVQQRVAAGLVAAVVVALSPAAGGPAVGVVTGASGGPAVGGAVGVQVAGAGVGAVAAPAAGPVSPSRDTALLTSALAGRSTVEAPAVAAVSGGDGRAAATSSRVGGSARWAGHLPVRQSHGVTVQTERHDTLWMLAEQYLGDGERYVEIVALNRGVEQPDGRALRDDGRIYPGWTLVLPADAEVDAARPDRHRVVPGDTLWAIAEDQLGDPTLYPQIVAANRGDLQPDGRRLTDPDLILPGWVLEVPGSEEGPAGESAEQEPIETAAAAGESAAGAVGEDLGGAPVAGPDAMAPIDRAGAGHPGAVPHRESVPVEDLQPNGLPEPADQPEPDAAWAAAPGPPRSAAEDESRGPTLESVGPVIPLPSGGAVTALLLAGVGAELVRRRRQFQRHRRPGERMPAPGVGGQQVERAVRAAGRQPGLDLVDRALGALAAQAEAGGKDLPDVRLVRVGAQSVVLDLGAPADQGIAPFIATDPFRWVLSAELLPAEAPDRPRAFPGLVTLGVSGSETVLVNLESVGTLAVTGPAEASADVLRGLAADLAFGPASTQTEQVLCVADTSIAEAVEAGGIAVEMDPARVSRALTVRLAAAGNHAGPVDPLAVDPLLIALCDQELDVHVPPRSGCALITTVAGSPAGATLVLHDAASALLLPERERLSPQHLSAAATGDVVEVLRGTDLPDAESIPGDAASDDHPPAAGGQTVLWDAPMDRSAVIDLRESRSGPGPQGDEPVLFEGYALPDGSALPGQASHGEQPVADIPSAAVTTAGPAAPRILLLGEVLVENAHGRCESTRIGRLAETAAFVLLNPGARPSELQGALWPGRRSNPQTCRQMISRARTWLGRTDAGEPYLRPFAETEGRLRLRDEVGSDWADFQHLATLGLADPDDTEHLTAALALVRGRPFGAVASRELPWADIHINEMISLISDVAHALAVRHEAAGRRSAARDAALRGLRTESESEMLEEIVARTAV